MGTSLPGIRARTSLKATAGIKAVARFLIESYARSQSRGFEMIGPVKGDSLGETRKSELASFRNRMLSGKGAHLLSSYQLDLEEKYEIDRRSFHFFALKNGKIRATIRLTPRPFEIEALLAQNPDVQLSIKDNAVEFNRLLVEMGNDSKGLGRALMLLSGCRGYYELGFENFYAICRGSVVEKFFKFGFEVQSNKNFKLEQRPGSDYALITGSATSVAQKLTSDPTLVLPKWKIFKKAKVIPLRPFISSIDLEKLRA